MGTIIDGKRISDNLKEEMKAQVVALERQYGRRPGLAVIIVGENPASQVYVRNKVRAAEFVGLRSVQVTLPESTPEADLLAQIRRLNEDPAIDGVLVQLPLPAHINEEKVIDTIALEKDVDGFHPGNVGALWLGKPCTLPCTPKGCLHLIQTTGIELRGALAVVIGRSNIVGKPMAKLLLDQHATVIMAHSRTRNLGELTRQADIIVAAVGKRNLVTADMVKPGAVVIDVGMNRDDEGHLCGDVDFAGVKEVAGFVTPVPGGVGPMTITMLIQNTLDSFIKRESKKQ
ncbi:MAG: bifunctional methylenetetrahydrofolate dehydrogenase/methenyltetrahydrofolate cyclohydrolase FolD [Bacteroidales bacterium]|nr:bifunctional methylenetetrahydrofolate dehydrogenase/methenyltetrahydrofolate cyclohydrolase FolD [Bacteroidales bacterium]